LREEFRSRFQDFRKHETPFRIFASPYEADVQAVPEKFQMELIELQSREKKRHKNFGTYLYRNSTNCTFQKIISLSFTDTPYV
jgi:hypothetical protein